MPELREHAKGFNANSLRHRYDASSNKARQSVIAKEANYSILQVKRIAKNIKFWRTRTPPKLKRQGRPPDIGAAMVQVRRFL